MHYNCLLIYLAIFDTRQWGELSESESVLHDLISADNIIYI